MTWSADGSRLSRLRRWLRPGTGIKRWLLLMFVGLTILATAGALLIRILFREVPADSLAGRLFELVSLNFLPDPIRPIVVITIGVGVFLYGLWRLLNVLLEPFPARREPLVELVYQKRSLARGPRIVAIGGGTGQSTLLRGLKEVSSNITAVVTVADDGGSSGKLREELGVPPVGDIRNCIAALADAEPAMGSLMQYRFPASESEPGVAGHALGNLLIAAMADITGDFEEGVRQSNRVLAVRGQVVPVAGEALNLNAELADGTVLRGPVAHRPLTGDPAGLAEPRLGRGQPRGGRGHRRRRSHRARARLALHEPAAEPARARHPRRRSRALAACACTWPTWPRSSARPRATRSRSTWPRSRPTTWVISSTSSWPTTTPAPASPAAIPPSPCASTCRGPKLGRVWSWPLSSTRTTPIATTPSA